MFQPRCHHSPENDFKRLCVQPHACVLYRICDAHCLLASVGLSFASFFVYLCVLGKSGKKETKQNWPKRHFSHFTFCSLVQCGPATLSVSTSGVVSSPLKQKIKIRSRPHYLFHGVEKIFFFSWAAKFLATRMDRSANSHSNSSSTTVLFLHAVWSLLHFCFQASLSITFSFKNCIFTKDSGMNAISDEPDVGRYDFLMAS